MRSGRLLLLKLLELRLGGDQRHPRLVEIGWRADAVIAAARSCGRSRPELAARLWRASSICLPRLAQIALEVVEVGLDARQLRLRLLGGQAIGHGIDGEQFIARLEELALDARRCARPCRIPPA